MLHCIAFTVGDSEFGGVLFVEDIYDYTLPDRPVASSWRVPNRILLDAEVDDQDPSAASAPTLTAAQRKRLCKKANQQKKAAAGTAGSTSTDAGGESDAEEAPADATFGRMVRRLFFTSDVGAIQSEGQMKQQCVCV